MRRGRSPIQNTGMRRSRSPSRVGQSDAERAGRDARLPIERGYYKLDGTQVEANAIEQNDRFVVVLKVTETEASICAALLVDRLPAGLRDRQSEAGGRRLDRARTG